MAESETKAMPMVYVSFVIGEKVFCLNCRRSTSSKQEQTNKQRKKKKKAGPFSPSFHFHLQNQKYNFYYVTSVQ